MPARDFLSISGRVPFASKHGYWRKNNNNNNKQKTLVSRKAQNPGILFNIRGVGMRNFDGLWQKKWRRNRHLRCCCPERFNFVLGRRKTGQEQDQLELCNNQTEVCRINQLFCLVIFWPSTTLNQTEISRVNQFYFSLCFFDHQPLWMRSPPPLPRKRRKANGHQLPRTFCHEGNVQGTLPAQRRPLWVVIVAEGVVSVRKQRRDAHYRNDPGKYGLAERRPQMPYKLQPWPFTCGTWRMRRGENGRMRLKSAAKALQTISRRSTGRIS